MGRIGFAPDDKTMLAVVGYAGPEQTGNTRDWRKGVNLVVSRKITPKLTAWAQGDYGTEEIAGTDVDWWAGGLWLSYDLTDKIGIAVRGDVLDDHDGARTSGSPFTAPFPGNSGQTLTSLTATLNIKPYANLQIRPELRWDYSSEDLFGHRGSDTGRANQFTAAVGVAYLF